MLPWLDHLTLDIIGETGKYFEQTPTAQTQLITSTVAFGYDFDSLHGSSDELAQAFDDLLGETAMADPINFIAGMFPWAAKLVMSFFSRSAYQKARFLIVAALQPLKQIKVTANALAVLQKVGQELVDLKRKELESLPDGGADELLGKDILHVLLRSNMREVTSQMMTDEEVIARAYAIWSSLYRLSPALTQT